MTVFSEIINNLKKVINPNYLILHEGCSIKLIESGNIGKTCRSSLLHIIANLHHLAFTLDARDLNNLPLNPIDILNKSTQGVSSKNDLIVLCPCFETNILNVFIIEMKSLNSNGAAHQIKCGKVFTSYLLELNELLNPCRQDYDIKYYGVLAKQPRHLLKPTTNLKSRKYHFNKLKDFDLKLMEWNVNEKLPLTDIHKKLLEAA